jgi:hypothetical protein
VKAGAPVVVQVPAEQNPDVIWVVREVTHTESLRGGTGKTVVTIMYGLFACYRSPTPGEPQCFLARTVGDKSYLVWPDDPSKYKFDDGAAAGKTK